MLQMMFEISAEEAKRTGDRRTGHVDQRTVSLTAIEIEHLPALFEQTRVTLSFLDSLKHRGQHTCLHPAGGTLAAAFLREKSRKCKRLFDHAGACSVKT